MKWNHLALLIFVSFFTPGQQFTVKTTVAAGPMCKIDSDCQENAYCFKNEVHFQKTGNKIFKTINYATNCFSCRTMRERDETLHSHPNHIDFDFLRYIG